jgi:hypothetical protein
VLKVGAVVRWRRIDQHRSSSMNVGIPCPHRVYAVVFPGAVIRRRYLR